MRSHSEVLGRHKVGGVHYTEGFPGGSVVKNLPVNAGDERDTGLIPELGRSPGEGNGTPLQYPCLEKSMDRGAWQLQSMGSKETDTTQHSTVQHTTQRNPEPFIYNKSAWKAS